MKPIEIIAKDLFDKVRSRFTNLKMGDENGAITVNPQDARFFDFDFSIDEVSLGRISISINELGNLKIYYSQGITKNADSITQKLWYDFLREMRFFAKRRLLRFDTRDITKGNLEKNDFQYLAQSNPKDNTMKESAMFGSNKTSHRKIEDTDLIIRHSEAIDPTKPGARSRKIKNLFIQNKEGERFKFPFIYLPGARAMQRHVANGGYPHDDAGKHIVKTCEEILKLSDFGRKVKHSTLNDNAHTIAERAGQKLKQLRHHMECMSKQGYYESWKENFASDEDNLTELDAATLESYKDTFTVNKFDESLADMFPLLHSIMQETSTVDLDDYVGETHNDIENNESVTESEFTAFEKWTDSLVNESFSDHELKSLEELVQQPLLIGANDEAVQALIGIGIKDPSLINALHAIAAMPNGADADARETIRAFMGADSDKISWGDLESNTPNPPTQPNPQAEVPATEVPPESQQVEEPELPPTSEGQAMLASGNLSQWTRDAVHRVAHGKIADWTELYSELVNDLGIDNVKAEKIAKRIFYHESVNPDNDEVFLNRLRSQQKSVVGTEDSIEPDPSDKLIEPEPKSSKMKDIAKVVMGFYDRENGTWTKGEHGVVTHVKRQFSNDNGKGGEKEAKLAAELIKHLNQQHKEQNAFEDIRRLAGLK